MKSQLARLLRPRSIAVIGGRWAQNVVQQCNAANYNGHVWPVHPDLDTIHGHRCYRSLDELPDAPDAAFIGVNRHTTIELVKQLSERGSGGAVCFASGFSEASAEDQQGVGLQQALLDSASTMPIIGPNCYGFINYLDGALLWPDQHGGKRVSSGVALLTQSSNIAINLTMQTRGLPIAYVLTVGNQAQLSLGEMAAAALEDERVTALGLHIEGFGDIRTFEAMAVRARELGKPIVAVKTGRSEQARQAMVSHTNSLSGNDVSSDALLTRLGIARVNSLSVLLESLKLFHAVGTLPEPTLQSMSCSGGEAGLMADAVVNTELQYPILANSQVNELRASLGPMVALANPLDYHTFIWNDFQRMYDTFLAVLNRDVGMTLLVLDFPRVDRCSIDDWYLALDALTSAQRASGARVAVLATLPENMPEQVAEKLLAEGIVPLCGIEDAMKALNAASMVGLGEDSAVKPLLLHETLINPNGQVTIAPSDLASSVGSEASNLLLTEQQAREQLSVMPIPFPSTQYYANYSELEEQTASWSTKLSFPVVLKGMGIAHKTESNAVVLNLNSPEELTDAAKTMSSGNRLAGLQIEEQILNGIAELLISVVREPGVGWLLTLASGGTTTELLKDSVHLLLPFERCDVDKALSQLSVNRLIEGFRSAPAANREAILNCVMNLQAWAIANHSNLIEVEINPLICGADKAVAADVLINLTGAIND